MTDKRAKVLCIHPDDDMLVALEDLRAGDTVEWSGILLHVSTPVQRKHKIARHDCVQGDILRLYGTPVGKATQSIGAGCAVTTDNLEHYAPIPELRATQLPVWAAPDVQRWQNATFQGVVRADGRVGTANHWLIFPLVFCENRNVEQLRDALVRPLGYGQDELADFTRALLGGRTSDATATTRPFPYVDGVRIITHQGGCGGTRADARSLCRILAAYADHPNVAGVTVFSLGCQNAQVDMFKSALAEKNTQFDKPCLIYEQQKWEGGEAAMMKAVVQDTLQQLAIANEVRRQPVPLFWAWCRTVWWRWEARPFCRNFQNSAASSPA